MSKHENYMRLAKKNKFLYERLMHYEVNSDVELVRCKEGHHTLKVVTLDGKKLLLNSQYHLMRDVERQVTEIDFHAPIITWIGFGMGHEAAYIAERIPSSTSLIIVEPNLDILKMAFDYGDLSGLLQNENIHIFGGELEDIEMQLHGSPVIDALLLTSVEIIAHKSQYSGRMYSHDVLVMIGELFQRMIKYRLGRVGNSAEDTLLGMNHFFSNFKYILQSPVINDLAKLYKGYPAICVASGPSLDKNIHILKKLQDKALIFCADSIWEKLLSWNIIPDAITISERTKHIYKMFFEQKFEHINESTCLIGQSVIYPKLFDEYKGKKIVCSKEQSVFERQLCKLLPNLNNYETGTSCAHVSFTIAKVIGCNPIILVGQDLAYGNDGYSHARGTWGENKTKHDYKKRDHFYVRSINGKEKVLTDNLLDMFRRWFEEEIRKAPSHRYINATEGGAYIAGMEVMTLQEVAKTFLNHKKEKIVLKDALETCSSIVWGADQKDKVLSFLLHEREKLLTIQQKLEQINAALFDMDSSQLELNDEGYLSKFQYELNRVIHHINEIWFISDVFFQTVQYYAVQLKQFMNRSWDLNKVSELVEIKSYFNRLTADLQRILNLTIYEYERGIEIIKSDGQCDNIDTPLLGEMYE